MCLFQAHHPHTPYISSTHSKCVICILQAYDPYIQRSVRTLQAWSTWFNHPYTPSVASVHSRLSCAHSRYIICTLQVYHPFARCHALSKVASACSRCILTLQAYHLHTPSASSFSYITKSLSADDSQLHRSSLPSDIGQTILSNQDCISDIKDRLTDSKLWLNEDKTEAVLFTSSKLQDIPAS